MVKLTFVKTSEEYKSASVLFKEYATWLNIDLSFQKFEAELKELTIMYGHPNGCIILASDEEHFIGCIAVRKIRENTCEIKRMYVKPDSQHQGVGGSLLQEAIAFSEKTGYKKIQLDTLNDMLPAIKLYKKNGFYEIPAYYFNPEPTAVYFQKDL